nr:MAG TPA: hypothetical protein [Caudoviricetes sp.]
MTTYQEDRRLAFKMNIPSDLGDISIRLGEN